jgi:hypothetical protein
MKRLKLKHVTSGIVFGEVLELVRVDGQLEYVVQNEKGRFFVKASQNVTMSH